MQQIGHYTILGELARGGMGIVFRGHDPMLDREVAIKVLLPAQGPRAHQRHERFLREAKALARLRHPNVVPIHQAGSVEDRPYLVMDLIDGESLQARIGRDGPLDTDHAAELGGKLARALAYVHEEGILHRDVKPDNVLISSRGDPLLTDLGLAKDTEELQQKLSMTGTMLGTPGYWPPEQAAGRLDEVGPHSDVYALGATLYACLTGGPPFAELGVAEMLIATQERDPDPPSQLRPGLDRALEGIVMKCLAKEPEDRYPTAEDLAVDLERYLRGELGPPRALLLALGGVVVLLAVVLGVLVAVKKDPPAEPVAQMSPPAPTASPARTAPVTPPEPTATTTPSPTARPEPSPHPTSAPPRTTSTPPARPPDKVTSPKQVDKARRLFARAMFKLRTGIDKGTLKDLNKVIQNDPTVPQYYLGRAEYHMKTRNPTLARRDLTKALALDGTNAEATLALVGLELADRRYAQALELTDGLIRNQKVVGAARMRRAQALIGLERLDEADRELTAVAECFRKERPPRAVKRLYAKIQASLETARRKAR